MKNFILITSLFVFVLYWLITIFFQLPDNPLKVEFIKENMLFETFFYQKWSFFAPPPKHDDRLYYYFRKGENIVSFEIIALLNKVKTEKAPFNSRENILDYILSNQMHAIEASLTDFYSKYNIKDTENIEKFWLKFYEENKTSYNIRTLLNYARIVAQENNLKFNEYEVKIVITHIDIPKFKDRHIKNIEREEKTAFETPFLKL